MNDQATLVNTIAPVPPRYRGVWRRTLLDAPGLHDVTTTVFWLQTQRWHADIRVPAARPDFSMVQSLHECDRAQLTWLARQQGFAGITQVDETTQPEICSWHRIVDYQPPAATPDAGTMQFEATRLVETGVHGVYLEHWNCEAGSTDGFAVLQRLDAQQQPAWPRQFLTVAGDYVMVVRERLSDWPSDMPADFTMTQLDDAALRNMLDFEISFGVRDANGWTIRHSTLPWLENTQIAMTMTPLQDEMTTIEWNGAAMLWRVLEWMPPI